MWKSIILLFLVLNSFGNVSCEVLELQSQIIEEQDEGTMNEEGQDNFDEQWTNFGGEEQGEEGDRKTEHQEGLVDEPICKKVPWCFQMLNLEILEEKSQYIQSLLESLSLETLAQFYIEISELHEVLKEICDIVNALSNLIDGNDEVVFDTQLLEQITNKRSSYEEISEFHLVSVLQNIGLDATEENDLQMLAYTNSIIQELTGVDEMIKINLEASEEKVKEELHID